MELRTTQRDVAGSVVLAIDGAADLASSPVLHDALQRLVAHADRAASIAVDLDGVTVIDDTALGLLLGAAAATRAHGCELVVVCADQRLRRRLADTRFDRAVTVAATLAAQPDRPPRGSVADPTTDVS